MKKRLAILGSTNFWGKEILDIVTSNPEYFIPEILSTYEQADLIIEQAKKVKPNAVVVIEPQAFEQVKEALKGMDIKVFQGENALYDVARWDIVDAVCVTHNSFYGVHSLIAAIKARKPIILAAKSSLVMAGEHIMNLAREFQAQILPIGIELTSLYQSLAGEEKSSVEKIIFTASGGPFLDKKTNFLVNVKKEHAFQENTINLSPKVLIDIATLINTGFTMIAAKYLWDLDLSQLETIIHPQGVVHSLVQFRDGSIKTQIGIPDFKIPILYALSAPKRISNESARFSFKLNDNLTFSQPDYKTFKNLSLAQNALEKGGNMPCILNAANDVVVHAFLSNKVGFIEMTEIIEKALDTIPFIENPSLEDLEKTDEATRKFTSEEAKFSLFYNNL